MSDLWPEVFEEGWDFYKMKNFAKKFMPGHLRERIRFKLTLFRNYRYDFRRFIRWSTIDKAVLSRTQMKAVLTKDYHRIEKALSLSNPRIPFGIELSKDLARCLKVYISRFGMDEVARITLNTLFEYHRFHKAHGHSNDHLLTELTAIQEMNKGDEPVCALGGYIDVSKEDIWKKSKIDLREFFSSRYSVRNFSQENVEMSLIKSAVIMAQKTPSVCNRQPSKVHVYSDLNQISEILKLQNGNSGFREQINKLVIVTSDLEHFLNIGERNQGWIDGGMFSMSLVYALHSLGLGTCCLNWSVEFGPDTDIRKVAKIPESESIIMLMAVGHMPSKFKVAQSPRKELQEVLYVH